MKKKEVKNLHLKIVTHKKTNKINTINSIQIKPVQS